MKPALKILRNRFQSFTPVSRRDNKKYMIASTQITNTEIHIHSYSSFFKLFTLKVLFIHRKYNRNCYKVYFFKKINYIRKINH